MERETIKAALNRRLTIGKILFRSVIFIVFAGMLLFTNTCTLLISHYRSCKVVAQWEQTDDVEYDGYSPYYVSVIERDFSLNPFTGFQRHYGIYAGKESVSPKSYGHYIDFSFYNGYEDIVSFIKKTNVEWKSEGITMTMSSGHQLFIPQKMFTGGR